MMEELVTIFNKRFIGFFAVMFVIWYPISLVLYSVIEVTQNPSISLAYQVFTPLLILLMAFGYFRKARNDWTARIVVSIGWMVLFFFCAAVLVEPVYGFSWRTIINWPVISANWVNVMAIIVGGIMAHPSANTPSEHSPKASPPSSVPPLPGQE